VSPAASLFALARPAMLPFLLLLPALGYGWGHWEHRLDLYAPGRFLWTLPAWTLVHAGTLWLNAALDRDQEEVLFGRAVEVPTQAARLGLLALALAVPLAAQASTLSALAAAGCGLLAIAYSHPRLRLKARPLAGPLINALGYGLLSPLAGWAALELPARPGSALVLPLLPLGLLAPFFVAQVHQEEADRSRGYRTLVVTHGPQACVRAASLALALALAWGLLLIPLGLAPPRTALGALAWLGVILWLERQRPRAAQAGSQLAQGLVLRMALATVLTIALVA